MSHLIYPSESYKIIGLCMEVHNELGKGFSEIVYKDALEYEFKKHNIPYRREHEFTVPYKDVILPHKFYADFTVWDKIVLEFKTIFEITAENIEQLMNYLAVSGYRLGIIANFRQQQLEYKRIVR